MYNNDVMAAMVMCRTDIYMYVVDGNSKLIITDVTYHEIDYNFVLIERHRHDVIGITVGNSHTRVSTSFESFTQCLVEV